MDKLPKELCALIVEHIGLRSFSSAYTCQYRDNYSAYMHEREPGVTLTLKALCLVNSYWHQLALPALASHVEFTVDSKSFIRVANFAARCVRDPRRPTHTLVLRFPYEPSGKTPADLVRAHKDFADYLLSEAIDALPLLRNLAVICSSLYSLDEFPRVRASIAAKQGLQGLTLERFSPDFLETVLLARKEGLRHLELRDCGLILGAIGSIAGCSNLEALAIIRCFPEIGNDDTSGITVICPLRHLHIADTDLDHPVESNTWLEPFVRLRGSLRSFAIILEHSDENSRALRSLLLGNDNAPIVWSQLRTLTMVGFPDMLPWARRIHAPALETVVLQTSRQEVGCISYELLLNTPAFRELVFCPCSDDDVDIPFIENDRMALRYACRKAGVSLVLPPEAVAS